MTLNAKSAFFADVRLTGVPGERRQLCCDVVPSVMTLRLMSKLLFLHYPELINR